MICSITSCTACKVLLLCSIDNQTRGTYHRLTHHIPSGCDPAQCDYFLGISTNPYDDDLLDFTLEGTAGGWIAVGFSKTPNMVGIWTMFPPGIGFLGED